MKSFWFTSLFTFLSSISYAETASFELSLSQALERAKAQSEYLKAAIKDKLAAQEKTDAAYSTLLPKLSLEANYRYVTAVPSFQVAPTAPSIQFGDHSNYSIGPTISYTLWDGGLSRNSYDSQSKILEARKEDERAMTVQLLDLVKNTYLKTQLGLEQLQLVHDSLKLARAQNQEIKNRASAGTASQLDLLTAQKEVLNYEIQFQQQQAVLASDLRDLLALLGDSSVPDTRHPCPKGFNAASVWLKLDSIEQTMQSESRDEPASLSEPNPQLKSQEHLAQALELSAKSLSATSYPQIQISARASYDYPNGPLLEHVQQNTFMLSFAMPLYEFNKIDHQTKEKYLAAEAARHRQKQLASDINRDFLKTKEFLQSQREQHEDAIKAVQQAETIAKLSYDSYRFGRISLVDVQAANLKALQAKLDLTKIRTQIIRQVITLKTLTAKEI